MSHLIEGSGDQQMRQTGQGEVLVRAQGVSKKFCRSLKRSLWYGVQDVVSELNPFSGSRRGGDIERELREGEFWAVNDVSFELRRGECLGLLGRNGAGKTTLLRMLNGLIKPDRGNIKMRGRVGALIALGAGFNPILTGRENIYVNASILGLSKNEIDERIDDIIEFSEIGDFIDAPVQSYSSGMQVRLGFAVATSLEPDILILDEVLAVGDAAFRAKCYSRVLNLRKTAAVIFVSHSMEQVARICDLGIVLSKGVVVSKGDMGQTIGVYENLNEEGAATEQAFLSIKPPVNSFSVSDIDCNPRWGESFRMRFVINSSVTQKKFRFRVSFYSPTGELRSEINYDSSSDGLALECDNNQFELTTNMLPMKPGKYVLAISIIDNYGDFLVWSYKQHWITIEGNAFKGSTNYELPSIMTRL